MTDTIWRRTDHWVGSQIEDAYVMLDIDGGKYVSLNTTAAEVWSALESPRSADQIVETLTARFEVPADRCLMSVKRLLEDFSVRGLIQSNA